MNVIDLAMKDVVLKKASTAPSKGGEWQGPCPACGGNDRFHVWPGQNNGQGGYWCRGCGKTGDAIQYLRDFRGMSFGDACRELGIDMKDMTPTGRPSPGGLKHSAPPSPPPFIPTVWLPPSREWQERAERFVAWASDLLLADPPTLSWLWARGISRDAATMYGLGLNPGEKGKDIYRPRQSWGLPEEPKADGTPKKLWIPRGLVIPHRDSDGRVIRIRIRRPEGEPRYYVIPGSSMATMVIHPERRAFLIVESELDAMAAASICDVAGAVGMGSAAAKPDAPACEALSGALAILNALDYDAAGKKAHDWWAERFARVTRWPVPAGKDPGEAFHAGIDLDRWIKEGLPPALTISDGALARPAVAVNTSAKPAADHFPDAAKMVKETPQAPAVPSASLPPTVAELFALLKANPRVKIINSPGRYTVLRDGKYVGGRINELVFRNDAVLYYIAEHPDEEISAGNFMVRNEN